MFFTVHDPDGLGRRCSRPSGEHQSPRCDESIHGELRQYPSPGLQLIRHVELRTSHTIRELNYRADTIQTTSQGRLAMDAANDVIHYLIDRHGGYLLRNDAALCNEPAGKH